MKGADVFLGLSKGGLVTPEMVNDMSENPLIFALANPDPEITPEDVYAIRNDAIVATGCLAKLAKALVAAIFMPSVISVALTSRAPLNM